MLGGLRLRSSDGRAAVQSHLPSPESQRELEVRPWSDPPFVRCIDEIVKQIQSPDAQQGGAPVVLACAGDI